ncbi:GumC family protein [Geomesophilobacter sediminis]|uniref:Lipopolysaccharide biosynthesis protein n=1 Tax=Geomesophilobacter sediminis TaxID=2798584 RepID=A0A8J7IYS9_9BACT|nr:GNVR domain-containing protein [Geomesophilobacter sediminis]MBJ6725357.1 lipopolysaccharide biosynthesis protein [Geomesophilobacter sediminis]
MGNLIRIEETGPGRGNRDYLRTWLSVIFKNRLRIAVVCAVCVAATAAASFLLPPVYETRSSILVKIGREYQNRQDLGNGAPFVAVSQEEMTNSEIQILTNRDLIKKVIATVGLGTIYPELARNNGPEADRLGVAAELFTSQLKVAVVRKSNVVQVSFRHRDPKVAARAVNTLVELYTVMHLQAFSDNKSPFLEQQLSAYEKKLRQSEDTLQKFKQEHGVYSLDEQRRLLLDQRTSLDTVLKSAENSIAEQQKKIAALTAQGRRLAQVEGGYTQTERDRIIVDARARLLSLRLEEQELLKKYTEGNRLVVNVRNEIRMVTNFMKEQEEEIKTRVKTANPVYQNVQIELIRAETDYQSQKAKAGTLRQQLRQLDGAIQALDFREKDIQKLKRDQTINEKNYQTYLERTEEARIADDMNRLKLANISVIEQAAVPAVPVRPNKGRNLVLGLFFGLVAGVAAAFFREYAAQSFSTPESVQRRLGVPVVAAIPYREGEAAGTSITIG